MYVFRHFRRRARIGTVLAALAVTTAGPLWASPAGAAASPAALSASSPANTTARDQLCLRTCGGPPAITVSWTLDTPAGQLPHPDEPGTITVHGSGFTPGDGVKVTMLTAGGEYVIPVTASRPHTLCVPQFGCIPFPGGTFTVTQPDVACGGNPDLGPDHDSDIDARDQQNPDVDPGSVLATPCPDFRFLLTSDR
jgi:hypothetical protein